MNINDALVTLHLKLDIPKERVRDILDEALEKDPAEAIREAVEADTDSFMIYCHDDPEIDVTV